MYNVLLVIWQLSFESELVGDGLEKSVAGILAAWFSPG